jgi:deoxyribonuclease V
VKLELHRPHRWELAPYEAQQVQTELQAAVVTTDAFESIRVIAGVAIAHSRFNDTMTIAVAALSYPDLNVLDRQVLEYQTKFPFIPDLLSFREVPGIIAALEALSVTPDLIVVDGPGITHPKGLGVASHVGVILDIPTIGCSKSSPVGTFIEPEVNAGSESALVWQSEIVGTVFRSKNRVAPLFISTGHRVGRETATTLIRKTCQGYRLPEPLRIASAQLTESKQSAKVAAAR